jgi:chromosome segregation ATPase
VEIQGQVLSISHAPALANENKRLQVKINELECQVEDLKADNAVLKGRIGHFHQVILAQGKERKKLGEERTKQRRKADRLRKKKKRTSPRWLSSPDQPGELGQQ